MAITHFMHHHNLTRLVADTSYICNGCRMHGTGTRFNCTPCDFDLHDYCAKCPPMLPFTTLHPHPMTLVVHIPQINQNNDPCKICNHAIQGLAYKCKDCIFSIHPLCVLHYLGTQYFLHPSHKLIELTADSRYICDGCEMVGTGRRFHCTPCDFDLHDYCAEGPTQIPMNSNHPHPMSLAVYKPGLNRTTLCQICHNPVQGLGYEYKGCNVWVHPLCSCHNQGGRYGDESRIFNQGHAYVSSGFMRPSMVTQNLTPAAPSGSVLQGLAAKIGIGVAINEICKMITKVTDEVFSSGDRVGSGDSDHGHICNFDHSDFGSS